MKNKELNLLKELVRRGFDLEFSRRCDDFDMELLKDFTTSEIEELSMEFSLYNGDPEEYTKDRFVRVDMISVGRFLFDKLLASEAQVEYLRTALEEVRSHYPVDYVIRITEIIDSTLARTPATKD